MNISKVSAHHNNIVYRAKHAELLAKIKKQHTKTIELKEREHKLTVSKHRLDILV